MTALEDMVRKLQDKLEQQDGQCEPMTTLDCLVTIPPYLLPLSFPTKEQKLRHAEVAIAPVVSHVESLYGVSVGTNCMLAAGYWQEMASACGS